MAADCPKNYVRISSFGAVKAYEISDYVHKVMQQVLTNCLTQRSYKISDHSATLQYMKFLLSSLAD
jgi:hypothetical protein